MRTTIYWFSGTGNSLYAANRLAELLGDAVLVPMAKGAPAAEAVGGEGHRLGFVFPSYYGDLPRMVRSFVDALNILPGTDIFAVVTMGAFGQGSAKAMGELLGEKGIKLRYGIGIGMPANYILKYDPALFGAKSDLRVEAKLNKADKKIQTVAKDIADGKEGVKTHFLAAKTLYKDIALLDSDFWVTEKCTGCGLCERVCPAENIEIEEGKPVWKHGCEHCVSCISWCPAAAIEYGQKTVGRTRYCNPFVKIDELGKAKTETSFSADEGKDIS